MKFSYHIIILRIIQDDNMVGEFKIPDSYQKRAPNVKST